MPGEGKRRVGQELILGRRAGPRSLAFKKPVICPTGLKTTFLVFDLIK